MKRKLAEKICAALLAGTLAVSMLTGCGGRFGRYGEGSGGRAAGNGSQKSGRRK
jgi:hypothetical protein